MENGIFNRRNVISICVVAAVIVILTIVFLSRSNTGDEHIDDIQKDRVKYEDMQNKRAGTEQVTSQQTAGVSQQNKTYTDNYLLQLQDGQAVIYRGVLKNLDIEYEFYDYAQIDIELLPECIKKECTDGLGLNGEQQLYDFIPVYVACGGTELGGMDYIVARKVLKKFESMNVTFVRDEITGLITYIDKLFGKAEMQDSKAYLRRIQNLY